MTENKESRFKKKPRLERFTEQDDGCIYPILVDGVWLEGEAAQEYKRKRNEQAKNSNRITKA